MSHLSTDRLAALGDDEPTPAEAAHLAACAECARERDAYRTLVAMAHAERDAVGLPLTRWESIAGAIAAESVAVGPERTLSLAPSMRGRPRHFVRAPLRAAAAVLLVAGGVMAGRVSAGERALPIGSGRTAASSSPANASLATTGPTADAARFASIEEARVAQQRSEALYQRAAAFLAEHDTAGPGEGSPVAYKSRLAALDQMISTTREAMREAPHDPVLNGYYLTTLGQREATLRQYNTALPASLRSNSF